MAALVFGVLAALATAAGTASPLTVGAVAPAGASGSPPTRAPSANVVRALPQPRFRAAVWPRSMTSESCSRTVPAGPSQVSV